MTSPAQPTIPPAGNSRAKWIAATVASVALLVALFAAWPYQHGHFDHRQSLFQGFLYAATEIQDGEWIFCLFVPFITAFLVYLQRHRLRCIPIEGHASALAILAVAVAIYWLGYKADTRYPGFLAIQTILAALVVWFAGWRLMIALFLPWLFFSFTWPMLPLETILAFPLRVLTAKASTGFLNVIGIDAVRQGTGIVSAADPALQIAEGAKFSLDVATPCSGIRSLFSLMMISAFYSFISLDGTWKRLVLFASSIPLAMLGNFVRTVMLTTGSLLFGSTFAIGEADRSSTFHMVSGFVVFAVALAGMFAFSRFLESSPKKSRKKPSKSPATSAHSVLPPPFWKSATIVAIGAATISACYFTPVSPSLTQPGLSLKFPVVVNSYGGEELPMTQMEREVFPEGVELTRYRYHGSGHENILATIVVSGGVKRSLHEPEVCLPGQGWSIDDRRTITVELADGRTRNAMLLALHRDARSESGIAVRHHAYNIYWYEGFNLSTPSYQEHVVLTHLDNIFRNISHRWSMASFFTQLPPQPIASDIPQNGSVTVENLKAFVAAFAPQVILSSN